MANMVRTEAWATVSSMKGTALPGLREKVKKILFNNFI